MSEAPQSNAHYRLDQAATRATELVQAFANVDDPFSTDPTNPWLHPDRIFQELRTARDELVKAWNDFEQQQQQSLGSMTSDHKQDGSQEKPLDPERRRALYMDMITDAFADTLEDMRKTEGDNNLNVDILVDCLQSGLDLLTSDEQDVLFSKAMDHEFDNDDNDNDGNQNDDENLTCHEKRRREMGLDVPTSS